MSTYKDELNSLFGNIGHYITTDLKLKHMIAELRVRALEIVMELEDTRSTAWKASNAQHAMIARARDEARELRTKLESKNKTLGLVVMALAETIGEQER